MRSGGRNVRSQRSLGRSALRRKDWDAAVEHLDIAVNLNPLSTGEDERPLDACDATLSLLARRLGREGERLPLQASTFCLTPSV